MYTTNVFTGVLARVIRVALKYGEREYLVMAMPEDGDIELAYWSESEMVIAL